jgi:hypothetical protein
VDVDHPEGWNLKQLVGQELAVRGNHAEVRLQFAHLVQERVIAQPIRLKHGHAERGGKFLGRCGCKVVTAPPRTIGL